MNDSDHAPLVLLGLDACDVDLMQRWADDGRMPFLKSLLETGAFVRLDSTRRLFGDSPWPTANTGTTPAKHAFYNHLQLQRGTTWIERVDAHHCRVLPFWSYLRGTGVKLGALDVPKTFPIDGVDGVQICAWGEHYQLLKTAASEPPSAVDDIERRFGPYPHPPEVTVTRSHRQERGIYDTLSANLEKKRQATEYLLGLDDWDLFISVFSEIHYAGHQFYHHCHPGHWAHNPSTPDDLKDALPRIHSELDAALASVFEHLPENTTYLVFSVHGLETNVSANHLLHDILEKLGYLLPAQHPAPEDLLGRVLQQTRKLREFIPDAARRFINTHLVSEAAHDRAHASAFSHGIDWDQTRAFPLEGDHFQGFVSANLKGREPHGTVEKGADLDALLDEIRVELKQLVNVETGEPAVHDVVRISDVYPGPSAEELPDLVVQWAGEGPIRAVRHPRVGTVSMEGFALRQTQHAPDGFLIAGGPRIRAEAELDRASTLDLAPTILHLLGQPVPDDLDGQVLSDLLAPQGESPLADVSPTHT
ncbi:alkaline phosphatase family protein [Rubrivirga sp. IMCC43871]|uniref:alkaline phosphatase family protein n=1 Tax=Rubrivirga sp. IMCC43871 TaxID=3391575 RepID=UPI00399004E4